MSRELKSKISTIFMLVVLLAQALSPAVTVFADEFKLEEIGNQEMVQEGNGVSSGNQRENIIAMMDEGVELPPETMNPSVQETGNTAESNIELENDASIDEDQEVAGEADVNEEDEESERAADDLDNESIAVKNLGDIFKFSSFIVNGKSYSFPIETPIIIDNGTKVEVNYLWDTEERVIKAGDIASLELPSIFKRMRDTPKADLIVKDEEGNQINVGTFEIIKGHLILTFNEKAETEEIYSGYAVAELEFTLEETWESIRNEIDVNDEVGRTIPIIIRPKHAIKVVEKTGQADKNPDANYITWTVDVVNASETTLPKGVVTDKIPEGLSAAYEFEVYQLDIDLKGNKSAGDRVENREFNEFPIEFDNMEAYSGYRIIYKTKIMDKSKAFFENIVSFNDETNTGIVKDLIRSHAIEKEDGEVKFANQDGEKDTISWTVWVNKNGIAIENTQIFDELPTGLILLEKTIKIYDKDNNDVTDDFFITPGTGFPIALGNIGEEEQYRIEYVTEIDYSLINDGIYKKENLFTNTAILKSDETEIDRDTGEAITKNRKSIISKSGAPKIDYVKKEITWTVDVNSARHPFKGEIIVTDTLPEGVSIDISEITITDSQGKDVEGITPTLVDGKVMMIFPSGSLDGKTAKITYTTTITDVNQDNFENVVGISGEGVGEEGNKGKEKIPMPENRYAKNAGNVNYQKRTIGWEVIVEPIRDGFETGLMITDIFDPHYGMIFLDNSNFKVYLGEEVLDRGTAYGFIQTDEGDQTGFVITMNIPVNDKLVVRYETSFDPDLVKEPYRGTVGENFKYTNLAVIEGKPTNSEEITKKVEDSADVNQETTNNGKKSGEFITVDSEGKITSANSERWMDTGGEKKIAWDVFVNYREANLGTGVVVTDTLAYEGEIDKESVTIQTYTVNADGTIDKPYDNSEIDYTPIVSEGGKTLTVTFNDPVEQGYVISFTSSVPPHSEKYYTNNVLVESDNGDTNFSDTKTYKEWDDYLSKEALIEGEDVYVGEEIEWKATVNQSLSVLEEAVITDKMSAGHTYIQDSLEVIRNSDKLVLKEETDYKLKVTSDPEIEGGTILVIEMKDTLTGSLTLKYKSVVTVKEGKVNNQILLKGTSFEEESILSKELSAKQFVNVGGKWNPKKGALRVLKIDLDEKQEGNEEGVINIGNEAVFELSFDLYGERIILGEFSTVNGILEIENLELRTYYLREIKAPEGYILADENLYIPIEVLNSVGKNKENIVIKKIENIKEKINISVQKKWEVGPTVKPAIKFQLFRNGIEVVVGSITLDGNEELPWTYQWNDLDRTDMSGKPYEYTIEELEVPEGYEPTYDYLTLENKDISISVTNTYIKPTMNIDVQKFWRDNDNQDGVRPESITVRLFAGEDEIAHQVLNNKNDWSYTFEKLPVYQVDEKINYTVTEDRVDGYLATISFKENENRFEIINRHTPGKTAIDVVKNWVDQGNIYATRPEAIKVHLLADGKRAESLTLTEKEHWKGSFEDLDTHIDGKLINYTLIEEAVLGYETTINQSTGKVTNTMITTEIHVNKTWSDFDDQYNLRPEEIKVRLLQNGEILEVIDIATITSDKDGVWSYTFTDLPKFNLEGQEYVYSVEEEAVTGYQTSIVRFPSAVVNSHYFTIVNTLVTTEITGQKLWIDDNDEAGLRPAFITVNLLQNGEQLTSMKVTPDAKGEWHFTFEDLPKVDETGKEYVYIVTEVEEPDYFSSVEGTTITNILKEGPIKDLEPEEPFDPEGEVKDAEDEGNPEVDEDKPKPSGKLPETGGKQPPKTGGNKPGVNQGKRLPQTGEKANSIAMILGISLTAVVVGIWISSRRKEEV